MWRRSLAATVALATSLAAGAASAEEADMARMHRRAEALAQRYLVGWSSGNAQALADVQALYGPRVNFYGKFIDQRSLFAQKRSFGLRWPIRRYSHRPGTMQVTCDAATKACLVRSIIDWRAASPARGAVSRGASTSSSASALPGRSRWCCSSAAMSCAAPTARPRFSNRRRSARCSAGAPGQSRAGSTPSCGCPARRSHACQPPRRSLLLLASRRECAGPLRLPLLGERCRLLRRRLALLGQLSRLQRCRLPLLGKLSRLLRRRLALLGECHRTRRLAPGGAGREPIMAFPASAFISLGRAWPAGSAATLTGARGGSATTGNGSGFDGCATCSAGLAGGSGATGVAACRVGCRSGSSVTAATGAGAGLTGCGSGFASAARTGSGFAASTVRTCGAGSAAGGAARTGSGFASATRTGSGVAGFGIRVSMTRRRSVSASRRACPAPRWRRSRRGFHRAPTPPWRPSSERSRAGRPAARRRARRCNRCAAAGISAGTRRASLARNAAPRSVTAASGRTTRLCRASRLGRRGGGMAPVSTA